ncbi:Ribosomal RNA-processing protein 7 A [Mactra antiquata]
MSRKKDMEASDCVTFEGFTVVPMKVTENSDCLHYLYIKDHSAREISVHKPKDRTLFVLNVPPYCDEQHITEMFEHIDKIQRVYIHNSPSTGLPHEHTKNFFSSVPVIEGYKVAYIVFKAKDAVSRAKKLPYNKPLIMHKKGGHPITSGLSKWINEYKEDSTVDTNKLQSEIDEYMKEYDDRIQQEIEKAKAMDGVADEDGWVTVTRYGKNKAAPRTEAHEKALTKKERKRRKDKELMNFYSFQIKESKKEHIANLRRKFEEDKQRIALMKASRKFRPY